MKEIIHKSLLHRCRVKPQTERLKVEFKLLFQCLKSSKLLPSVSLASYSDRKKRNCSIMGEVLFDIFFTAVRKHKREGEGFEQAM